MSPAARSLAYLRNKGFLAESVEKWIAQIGRKRDLFNAFDILAIHPHKKQFLLVQATVAGCVSARLKKVQAALGTAVVLEAGGEVQIHGWSKDGDGRWHVRRLRVTGTKQMAETLSRPIVKQKRRSRERYLELWK